MKIIISKILRLMVGYFLYGFGIVLTVNAHQGLGHWSVLDQGLSLQLNITMGTATQIVGIVILVLDWIFSERVGWGTIGNVIFIGTFLDLIMLNQWIPIPENIIISYAMIVAGMVVIAVATYIYLGAQMGAGPRDGLMIALTKHTSLSVVLIRNILEAIVLAVGYLMGGSIGFGTLIMVFVFGRFIQLTFRLFKFDVRQISHHTIDQDFAVIFNRLKINKKE